MNGSLNSGGVRSVRLPATRPHNHEEPEPESPAPEIASSSVTSNEVGKREVLTTNPIILLGEMERQAAAVASTVKELPRSYANLDNRLRSIITSCSAIARCARELLEDEARRQEASL